LKSFIITIDGPAASGKEKIAKFISRKYKLKHIDSGLIYRKIAFFLINKKIKTKEYYKIKKIMEIFDFKKISLRNDKRLRNEKIGKYASKIAVYSFVRKFVNFFQHKFVKNNSKSKGFVIDGRDIGSVVFRNADLKLYIEVNAKNRANRRYKQLIDMGEKSIYPKILKGIKLRDIKDKKRKNSPLIKPKGCIVINNNGSFRNTISQINEVISKKLN